jgi:transcriptional regulator with XRE-family HTH domain
MEEFGQKLREVRTAKGYTQQALAEKLYVTRQTVSRWESGNRYPDLETLKKISAELEVSVDELLSMESNLDGVETTAEEEKTPVVFEKSKERNIKNRVIAVLYMIIIAGLTIYLLGSFKENGIFNSIFFTKYVEILGELALFILGLIAFWKEKDNPKKSGIVVAGYFVLEAVGNICYMWSIREFIFSIFDGSCPNPEAYIYILIDCLIKISVYFIGTVGAGLYFYRKRGRILGGILIYDVSAYVIYLNLKSIFSTIHVIQENSQSMADGALRLNVLYFVICVLVVMVFCCQILMQKTLHVDNKNETFSS